MATVVLQVAGSVLGSIVGGPVGAAIGQAIGAAAGAAIDASLLSAATSGGGRTVEGPRLKDFEVLSSTEGAPIPRVYGRARVGGQLIWATPIEETATVIRERGRSKGAPSTKRTEYSYHVNLAVGLCEGPIAFVRRVWADGRELDLSLVEMRIHGGGESQEPDPLLVARIGAGSVPAYRGLAYAVFERLPLADFGNRIPQLAFEVVRPVDGLARMIRAVCLIPGASEFAYAPGEVVRLVGPVSTRPENRHQLFARADVHASLDALQALCPNLERVSVVASWFGDDLRAGHCTIAPRTEAPDRDTYGATWSAAGLTRANARVVSHVNGRPAYGGTPADESLIRLVHELKRRGLAVTLYPFVMMDIAAGNGRPDPYGRPEQPPFPWRGRITCDPAPGRAGTPDGTPAAGSQVAALVGTCAPGHFWVAGGAVGYAGPEEWSLRRLILHYAHLALAAGGVDAFIIGSELVGLTRVRAGSGVYPAAAALAALAADVRAVLGPATRITYAADWTEYGAHVLEGGAEVRFPLDPLWAHPAIDAVGIDYYPPLSDWRDGSGHRDAAEARGPCDTAYLRRRLASGEGFDWYYASDADRASQTRTPIADRAYGKAWMFRAKDLVSWWSLPHVERRGGLEIGATAWVPGSKPIWLTEIGVPAVDKGANGPNVFPDPKSSESAYPPFSSGARDDLVQARALEAILSRFDPALPGHEAGMNPLIAGGTRRMVDPSHVYVWAWDARPFPAFPDYTDVWADGENWRTGHWLTGRLEGVPLDRLVAAVLAEQGIAAPLDLALDGFLDGAVIDRPVSARGALEPILRLFGADLVASGGVLRGQGRGAQALRALDPGELAVVEDEPVLRLTRAQETDLPRQMTLSFIDGETEYRRAAVASRRLAVASGREARAEVAAVLRRDQAQALADAWLQDVWAAREGAAFALSPRAIAIEPGDLLALPTAGGARLHRVVRIADGPVRRVETRGAEPAIFAGATVPAPRPPRKPPLFPGRPVPIVLDLPASDGEPTILQYLAVAAEPWPGPMTVWRAGEDGFVPHASAERPARTGRTLSTLPPGPLWRWDRGAVLEVEMATGVLEAVSEGAALAGANLMALQGPDGVREILSAADVELVGEGRYRLTRLLRGLGGSEAAASRTLSPGASLVMLDDALVPLTDAPGDIGRPQVYRVGPARVDPGDGSVVEVTATAGLDPLRPLAPVHLRARRTPDGVAIAWIRRTRRDDDAWEPADVPLGEDGEAYEVDILAGGVVRRTLTAATPSALYPAALEVADFGAPQAALAVRVAQTSRVAGRGAAAGAVLDVLA
ncbi:baseplate multidomain protein megatron [Salinarimonas soli]|uniref:Host specificity protein n=1 Tax=Salinarimonas soli TaxID=1638099 RepID=A0A5B2VFW7_9HYPH|nr:glycoside hydrolase/phage tail family protein [Salinarimonas soli]KAA2237252.1 hypothetical protein F0L46_09580 [Salinarimonas soli]